MLNLISQFEDFLNLLLTPFNKNPKKIYFKAQILKTTIYNYKELAKLYKEQMQLGYSKFLSQIALGQSQSSILANAYFENDILDLINGISLGAIAIGITKFIKSFKEVVSDISSIKDSLFSNFFSNSL